MNSRIDSLIKGQEDLSKGQEDLKSKPPHLRQEVKQGQDGQEFKKSLDDSSAA